MQFDLAIRVGQNFPKVIALGASAASPVLT